MTSGTSYEFPPGVILDIPVEYEVNESARPQPCGISEVTNLKMDESASGKWPEGLYLEKDDDGTWHIRGTVSPENAPGSIPSPSVPLSFWQLANIINPAIRPPTTIVIILFIKRYYLYS